MTFPRSEAPRNHHVCIRYGDGFHAFKLVRGTTLGELAERVDGLDTLHDGAPLTIEILVERPQSKAASTTPIIISH